MTSRNVRVAVLAAAVLAAFAPLFAQSSTEDVLWRIRREATEHSRVLDTLHVLTDRYGPRLTGSPNFKGAADWAAAEMTTWGLSNAHLEPWEFGHPGWSNERVSAHLVAPVRDTLVVEVLAWTPGTNGAVRGEVRLITPPANPSEADFAGFLASLPALVKGRVVLVGSPQSVGVSFAPTAKRLDDDAVRARLRGGPQPPPPAPPSTPAAATPAPATPTPATATPTTTTPASPARTTPAQTAKPSAAPQPAAKPSAADIERRLNEALVAAGALARFNDAGRDHGQIRAFQNRAYDVTKAPPTLVVRHEDYGRLARLLEDGAVEVEVDIVNRTYPEGTTAHNVIAEIPGTDKAAEVIMLGGHLDSWHAATGATDNAIGVAVMMEVARVLKAVGVHPRRTIRVALWSGEEQGLLGSQAYVRSHFGTAEDPKPEFATFGGYFNIDSGTGRARGATVFGPPEAATVVREALATFDDLGVLGAGSTNSRARGGSDHTSFNAAGLPGISMLQDPIEYQSHSWHTNLDTYERIVPEDAMTSVIAVAGAVYQLAMRDGLLPRFSKEELVKLKR